MKISNETKVGALVAIAIALLIIGFNLLKGNSLLSSSKTIYAVYNNVNGLEVANPVKVNGLKVGSVSGLNVMDQNVGAILATLSITADINIPQNSVASIESVSLIGGKSIVLNFGNANVYLQDGDTIQTMLGSSLTSSLIDNLKPLSGKVQSTLTSLDTLLADLHSTLDNDTRKNLRSSIAAFNVTMHNFSSTSANLDQLVQKLNVFTKNLNEQRDTINNILSNTQKITATLAHTDIEGTINELQKTVNDLDNVINKINSGQGSLGQLIHDQSLYNNLQSATYNLNLLMEDLRLNPQRYVHFSLFGRKNEVQPLPGDTLNEQK